jgi:hypothetical protein
MARTRITAATNDLIDDSGSILLSLVLGEQIEYPIILEFVDDVNDGYIFEAAVVEGLNDGVGSKPTTIQPAGIQEALTVRTCTNRGVWSAIAAYNIEEYVEYNTLHYKLSEGSARVNATPPDSDPLWELFNPQTLYVQLPDTLGGNYNVSPAVDAPIYGFLELRVTEPGTAIFQHTWKPVRGLIEILFSPTSLVP